MKRVRNYVYVDISCQNSECEVVFRCFTNFHLFLEILECDSSPCLNEGKCIEGSFGSGVGSGLDTTESVYTCQCQPGFTGKNCETSKDYLSDLFDK